jgi:hypothetical protein
LSTLSIRLCAAQQINAKSPYSTCRMFNTLTSYLFGGNSKDINSKSNDDNDSVQQQFPSANLLDEDENLSLNLTTVSADEDDDDQDWLFVEKEEKKEDEDSDNLSRTDSESELQLVPIRNSPLHLRNRFLRHHDDATAQYRLSSNLPTLFPSSMDDSWFVTPPSCFTSTGPIQLETSPLENLLIEHPSMSVYCNIRRGSLNALDNSDDIVVLELSSIEIDDQNGQRNANGGRNAARNNGSNRISQYQQQQANALVLVRSAQKTQDQRKQRSSLGRSALERSNKTRQVDGRNGRKKRADLQSAKVSSRANNNRKC